MFPVRQGGIGLLFDPLAPFFLLTENATKKDASQENRGSCCKKNGSTQSGCTQESSLRRHNESSKVEPPHYLHPVV
jgi:hypothetical protein